MWEGTLTLNIRMKAKCDSGTYPHILLTTTFFRAERRALKGHSREIDQAFFDIMHSSRPG